METLIKMFFLVARPIRGGGNETPWAPQKSNHLFSMIFSLKIFFLCVSSLTYWKEINMPGSLNLMLRTKTLIPKFWIYFAYFTCKYV